jgi:hypothetical protein
MLESVSVKIEDLLLDPNNPRLVRDLRVDDHVEDSDVEDLQDKILERFDESGASEFFDISDLKGSMERLGYVGIDRIVVRLLEGTTKYVVVEGNRRVATMKKILVAQAKTRVDKRLREEILNSFRQLDVMKLETAGVSEEEVAHRIAVILGLRHHGSLMEWEPLPKAFNIYSNYLSIEPRMSMFEWQGRRGTEVASILSIRRSDVKKALRTYVAYLQLSEEEDQIKEEYYSLIEAAVTNSRLTSHRYLDIDLDRTFLLSDSSVERMQKLCQFENRHLLDREQRIIPRPQEFSRLARIVDRAHTAEHEAVRSLATALLVEIEAGEIDSETAKLKKSVEQAADELQAFEARVAWVPELNELLARQRKELDIASYAGIGNDRQRKDEVKELLKRIKLLVGIGG